MEHVIVSFPTKRIVYIDGEKNGRTNELLRLDTGTHVIDLGPVKNYKPNSRKVTVSHTTILDPMKIGFARK